MSESSPRRSPLMPLDLALEQLLSCAAPLGRKEWVSPFDADGRVLAEDVLSELRVPPNDNSAMDGYAVRCSDVSAAGDVLSVSQRIAAGQVGRALEPGSAARIFTGAPIPAGADAVVMQEDTESLEGGTRVRLGAVPQPGQWIRAAGEDIERGAAILRSGERLRPASLGLAAGMGRNRLAVHARPRVALFSTGDELVMPGEIQPAQMKPGAIYNSNRFFLRTLLQRLGCEVADLGIIADQRQATLDALQVAAAGNDLILTSGGVSVGEEDHVKPAVQTLGELNLWQIAIKPGKPFAYGRIGRGLQGQAQPERRSEHGEYAHFIGLPGNPVSSFVTFLLLVRPFLLKLQGVTVPDVPALAMRADFHKPKPDQRREFLRVKRNAQGGLDLFPNQSSGVLTSMHWADGLVDLPAGGTITAGDMVRFIPMAELLS